ncbi:MAG: response regulator [Candidatus Omnitrophica bacterium]|nr:response regulator [Candidatus Omnitrophota bacterium]
MNYIVKTLIAALTLMSLLKILLIDDDSDVCFLTKKILSSANFSFFSCQNPEQGLKLITESSFDLILLDIDLGEICGIEVLKQLKINNPNLKIIMFSGRDDEEAIRASKSFGADAYIPKPLDLKVSARNMIETINVVLNR